MPCVRCARVSRLKNGCLRGLTWCVLHVHALDVASLKAWDVVAAASEASTQVMCDVRCVVCDVWCVMCGLWCAMCDTLHDDDSFYSGSRRLKAMMVVVRRRARKRAATTMTQIASAAAAVAAAAAVLLPLRSSLSHHPMPPLWPQLVHSSLHVTKRSHRVPSKRARPLNRNQLPV